MRGDRDESVLADVIEEHVPFDGPYSRETVIAAATGVSHLVRYLTTATQSVEGSDTLEWISMVDAVLGRVTAAAAGMDQLLEQLGDAVWRLAGLARATDAHAASVEERIAEGVRMAYELTDQLNTLRQRCAQFGDRA